MDVLERWQATFNHEEPDYVSSFVQVIMNKKKNEIDALYGDDFADEDLSITPFGDYTLQKWCGFEASWGAYIPFIVDHPNAQHPRYLIQKQGRWSYVEKLPTGATRYRIENWDGHISEIMSDGRDINFYVDGDLYVGPGGIIDQKDYDPKATMELWTERLGSREARLVDDAEYDTVRQNLRKTIDKFQFLPIFGLPGFAENVRESFGIKAFSYFVRRYPEVIEHAAKLNENISIVAAQASAKAGIPFNVIADDVAYKHGVFCSPEQYKRFFAPIYKEVAEIIHQGGGKLFFHSDGFTEPYWPIWIDYCGFDGQESLEPQAWDLPDGEERQAGANLRKPGRVIRYLKEKYGDKFVLIGNMDMSTVMPLSSPEEVANVTKDIIESGAPGGGFVFACCTDITEATPLDNIIAMREAYQKYRNCYQN